MLCFQGPPRSDCKAMRNDFNCNMQKHSKCITFLICLQFSIINILYLIKHYFEAQAGYLVGKAVLWRVYTGNFSNR